MSRRLSPLDGLQLDIDGRMDVVRREMFEQYAQAGDEGLALEQVAALMRAAYGKGYVDALKECDRGERGKMCVDHGYKIPGSAGGG